MSLQIKPNGLGISRLFKAFHCSLKGFKSAFKHEGAFRQEVFLAVVLFPLSFVVAEGVYSWLLLNISIIFLLMVEIINSAIEALADKITLKHDELIGRAKDLGSAAVFLATLCLLIVWSAFIYKAIDVTVK
jgi:diacylglycerol kinase (ATP)